MKKIVLTMAFLLLVTTSIKAQGVFLGGGLGFWTSKEKTTFSLSPIVGYNFDNKWFTCLGVGYSYNSDAETSSMINTLTVNPSVRFNYWSKGIVSLFVEAGGFFAFTENFGYQAGISPGISLMLSKHISIETYLGFLGYSNGKYEGYKREGFGFNFSAGTSMLSLFYNF